MSVFKKVNGFRGRPDLNVLTMSEEATGTGMRSHRSVDPASSSSEVPTAPQFRLHCQLKEVSLSGLAVLGTRDLT